MRWGSERNKKKKKRKTPRAKKHPGSTHEDALALVGAIVRVAGIGAEVGGAVVVGAAVGIKDDHARLPELRDVACGADLRRSKGSQDNNDGGNHRDLRAGKHF
jgi:hypothetical protein